MCPQKEKTYPDLRQDTWSRVCLLQIRVPKLTCGLFFHRFSAVSRRALSKGKFYKGLAYKQCGEVIESMTTVSLVGYKAKNVLMTCMELSVRTK